MLIFLLRDVIKYAAFPLPIVKEKPLDEHEGEGPVLH